MKTLILFVLLLSLATASFADNERGLYAGAGVGIFNLTVDNAGDLGTLADEFDSDDTSFKVFGGWRFNPWIAAELDYVDFGGPDDDVGPLNVKAEIDGFAPYVIGTWPIGFLELFAKAGYLFYDLSVDVNDQEIASQSGSDEDFVYGAGLGITFLQHLNARLEYEVIDISAVDDADSVWLTGAWRF